MRRFLQRGGPTAGQHVDWMCSAQRLCGDDCDEIIEACDEFPLCPPSTVGEDRYPGHRKGDMRKIGLTPRTEWIFGLISDVATEAARVASGLNMTEINRAPQYMEYRPGLGQFDWHNDYSHGLPVRRRASSRLSFSFQVQRTMRAGGCKYSARKSRTCPESAAR